MQRLNAGATLYVKSECLHSSGDRLVGFKKDANWLIHRAYHYGSHSIYEVINRSNEGSRPVELNDFALFQIFGIPNENEIKATLFRAYPCFENDSGTPYKEFKTLAEAKSYLKRVCVNGFINANVYNLWCRVFEFYLPFGFKRSRMFDGLNDSGKYLRF